MLADQTHPFERELAQSWPAEDWCDLHLVLAVSAGPDSVAMLRAMWAIKQRSGGQGVLHVAHLNHQLRGADSDADQAWLDHLCGQLGVALVADRVDVAQRAIDDGDGWEAAARSARYDFLLRTAESCGARFIAVAHTADDQVETVLHRLLRGTGLAGLAGMPRARPLTPTVTLYRPLLEMRRALVLDYLDAIGQGYRTDASNTDLRYTRNRLRHELLPALRTNFNTEVDEALLRLARQADDVQQALDAIVAEIAERCIDVDPTAGCVRIDCQPLVGRPVALVREVCRFAWNATGWPLQAMGFDQWQQLADLAQSSAAPPRLNLPGDTHAERHGRFLDLRKADRAG